MKVEGVAAVGGELKVRVTVGFDGWETGADQD
jgi:hypothetical protein